MITRVVDFFVNMKSDRVSQAFIGAKSSQGPPRKAGRGPPSLEAAQDGLGAARGAHALDLQHRLRATWPHREGGA